VEEIMMRILHWNGRNEGENRRKNGNEYVSSRRNEDVRTKRDENGKRRSSDVYSRCKKRKTMVARGGTAM